MTARRGAREKVAGILDRLAAVRAGGVVQAPPIADAVGTINEQHPLVRAIGEDAARTLARRFGGTTVYVPRAIGEHHPLSVAIGRGAADKLGEWTGGSTLAIPKQAERRARVLELRRRAWTAAQIAIETGFSQRHVFRLLREEEEDRQPGLFD